MPVRMPQGAFETTREIVREAAADAPEIFGIGLDTLTGVALGGGSVGLVLGGLKLAKVLLTRNKGNQNASRQGSETAGGAATSAAGPFPRHLEEARQQRELAAYTERRIPEYDTAVGRIVEDEVLLYAQQGSEETRTVIQEFWSRVRARADKLMPPSVREYLPSKESE